MTNEPLATQPSMSTRPKTKSKTHDDSRYHVPNLERALRILEYLDQHPTGRTMMEIGEALGLPKNSVFRITMTLVANGYLDRDPDSKRLVLSRKILALGYAGRPESGIVSLALEGMRSLRDALMETVCISVLLGDEGFVLEQAPGLHSFRFVADIGTRQPLHTSASCKAILAYLSDDELEPILDRMAMPRMTARTITGKEAYRDELRKTRDRGYALDNGEHLDGVVCVAAPILDRHGYPVASITVTGPAARMPEEAFDTIGRQIKEHAARISARLGNGG